MTTDDWRTETVLALSEAIASLDDANEVAGLLRDLCTRREITEMASRWQIVRLLDSGLSYRDIAQQTGASTATVTRVSQWLNHGTGGYQMTLARIKEQS
ncbi:MAG: YerC/YecD family TrpR-related protein [Acidimicrobiia bacterium]|nr:YerC/YecD family TrpR-related protein [Acidimicrobiia bacterium]